MIQINPYFSNAWWRPLNNCENAKSYCLLGKTSFTFLNYYHFCLSANFEKLVFFIRFCVSQKRNKMLMARNVFFFCRYQLIRIKLLLRRGVHIASIIDIIIITIIMVAKRIRLLYFINIAFKEPKTSRAWKTRINLHFFIAIKTIIFDFSCELLGNRIPSIKQCSSGSSGCSSYADYRCTHFCCM